jgi:hypothetical protein
MWGAVGIKRLTLCTKILSCLGICDVGRWSFCNEKNKYGEKSDLNYWRESNDN